MKKISIGILALSLIMIYLGYGTLDEGIIIARGNRFSLKKEYTEADRLFEETITKYNSEAGGRNRAVNLYNGEEYDKLIEIPGDERFLRGNSYAYLGEREGNPEKRIENYEKALDEYRNAMKESGDINIKKNYEIISKRVEDMKKTKQEQQEQNKQNKNQEDPKKEQQQGRDKQENSDTSDKKQTSQGDEKDSGGKEQPDDKIQEDGKEQRESSGNEDNKVTEKQEASLGREVQEDSLQKIEALTILERLESNESQAFKNNEKLEKIGGEPSHEDW